MKEILDRIKGRITKAAIGCGRNPDSVRLVAVSKTVNAQRVAGAIDAGVTILGENYIQEAREKFDALIDRMVSWHFIGHLQSNKAKYAVRMFDLIHSVDSLKLAKALDGAACKIGKVQDILVQVNISGEASKSGSAEDDTESLIEAMSQFENLRIRGLMTMPPYYDEPDLARPFFRGLKKLGERIANRKIPGVAMDEFSMGMTGDFEVAIEEGATLVRIGTAIFGARK